MAKKIKTTAFKAYIRAICSGTCLGQTNHDAVLRCQYMGNSIDSKPLWHAVITEKGGEEEARKAVEEWNNAGGFSSAGIRDGTVKGIILSENYTPALKAYVRAILSSTAQFERHALYPLYQALIAEQGKEAAKTAVKAWLDKPWDLGKA